ncbi:MAG TPA: hypothetical protein VMF66_00940 [Candidatus Acidoferrum sp.]|nr:hypothetical protein [Candidatus Acidoferrum sp.]
MESGDPNKAASELVILRRFHNLPEMLLAKSILDSAEIECFLQDENMVGLDWLASSAFGGVKLVVKKNDAVAADELLSQKGRDRHDSAELPRDPR